MKKVLIVASYLSDNKLKLVELLSKHFKDKVEFHLDSFKNFTLYIDEKGNLNGFFSGTSLESYDFVYIRSKTGFSNLAKTVAICLESNKIKYADKAIAKASYIGNKLTSLSRMAMGGVSISPSIYAYNLQDKFNLKLIKELGFPLVIKDLKSQRMEGVFVVSNQKELLTFIKNHNKNKFIVQKIIDIENEYRIFVIEGKAVSAHTKAKRNYSSGKLSYMNQHEWHKFIDLKSLPKKIKKEAEKAAKELWLDIAGVDVCIDKNGKVFCLEVNRGPGIDYEANKTDEIDALVKFFQQKTR